MVRSHRDALARIIHFPMHRVHARALVRSIACALVWVGGCAPAADQGECSVDADCEGRGEVCDVDAAACIDGPLDTSSTGTATPTLTAVPVPFHRGTVCYSESVKAGSPVPVSLAPCLHPCLTAGAHFHSNYYSCVGSTCDAWAFVYFLADGVDCPADAFGSFPRNECDFTQNPVNLSIGTTIGEGEPVLGTMTLEVPFLTNADVQVIDAAGRDTDLMNMKIDQYATQDNRIAGDISLLSCLMR